LERTPFFTALVYEPQSHTYGGGGHWRPDGRLHFHADIDKDVQVSGVHRVDDSDPTEWVCGLDDHPRLRDRVDWRLDAKTLRALRSGWRVDAVQTHRSSASGASWCSVDLVRELPHGLVLRPIWSRELGRERFVIERDGVILIDEPSWTLADRDADRLIWSTEGCLYAAPVVEDGLGPSRVLFDTRDIVFEQREAPYRGVSRPPAT
jgi:hypothetical protein